MVTLVYPMKKENYSPVKILNYLRDRSQKFVGENKPYPNETQLVNDALRKFLEKMESRK